MVNYSFENSFFWELIKSQSWAISLEIIPSCSSSADILFLENGAEGFDPRFKLLPTFYLL